MRLWFVISVSVSGLLVVVCTLAVPTAFLWTGMGEWGNRRTGERGMWTGMGEWGMWE